MFLIWTKRAGLLGSIHRGDQYGAGAILFPLSLTLCALIYWPIDPLIFQAAALILGLADGLAGLSGKYFGRWTYKISGPKTIEGSLTFFGVAVILLAILIGRSNPLNQLSLSAIFLAGLILTFVEALFSRGWDNLWLPLAAGWLIYTILNL